MQFGFFAFLLGEFPRLTFVDHDVGDVSQRHDFAQGAAEFALLVRFGNTGRGGAQGPEPFGARSVADIGQRAAEFLADEPGATAGDIDVFACLLYTSRCV